MKKFLLLATVSILFFACSGDNGADGRDGLDGTSVDIDSLMQAIREEMANDPATLVDSTLAKALVDEAKKNLIDSIKQSEFDTLYGALYDSLFYNAYSQSAIKNLEADVYSLKEDIYTAFANQYPLMYKDFTPPQPISVKVYNNCSYYDDNCRSKKVMVKTWVENYSDTSTITETISQSSSKIFKPQVHFKESAYLKLKAPAQANFQIRAYALENDTETLFYSTSEPTTIHPVQVNGPNFTSLEHRKWWYGVWVTPGMDSIQNILNDISAMLPAGQVLAYQLYSSDKTIAQSTERVVKAIFEVLQARNITYVQNESAGSPGQKIKYPVEVLRTRQGLCIETTVLFASILEAIGIQAFIVSIPRHAFIAYRVEEDSDTINFVETTVMNYATGYVKTTFAQAQKYAKDHYDEEVAAGTFESGESELIDIEKVRMYGIMPNNIP